MPQELRDTSGISKLTQLLNAEFATRRNKQLYCVEIACSGPDFHSEYADLLKNLTLLSDTDAITYHWQGRPSKNNHADHVLVRVRLQANL